MGKLRLALAQMNATVGDFGGNLEKIGAAIDQARAAGADIVAFPELAVCGYPPEDLLLKPAFVEDNRTAVEAIARMTHGITAIVGFVDRGVDLFNAAAVLHDGAWAATYRKQRLPNYGVFDELRYFRAGRRELLLRIGEASVGISICEDVWVPGGPVARLSKAGADVIVNINASPYHRGKWQARHSMLSTRATDHGVAMAYVNLVGGQDELVFDGDSMVIGPDGQILAESPLFEEDLLICDVELEDVFRARLHDPKRRHATTTAPRSVKRIELTPLPAQVNRPPVDRTPPHVHDDVSELYAALQLGLRDYVQKNNFRQVVLGLSGGIDSALVATIAADTLSPENVICVMLPSQYSSEGSVSDSVELAARLGVRTETIPIEPLFNAAMTALKPTFEGTQPGVAEENIQARARGVLLMALSNKFDWLLLTTGNKSELATGYATLYGDMAGGFALLKDVSKLLVYELCRWRNLQPDSPIPTNILEKPPSAELRPDQRDSDSLPPYEVLDPVLQRYVEEDWSVDELIEEGFDEAVVRRVARLVDASEYKRRQAAPGVKVTERAFGKDRRLPITSKYY
ncbi:MAG TPA: NAD+ synthase [Longimicrobiales bacterium]